MSGDDVKQEPGTTPATKADAAPGATLEPQQPRKKKVPPWRRLLKSNLFRTIVLFGLLLLYGTYRFEKLILNPPEKDWGPVSLEDLSAERWYETEKGKQLSQELSKMTDRTATKVATGMFYRFYKKTFASGVLNTQYVRVGPDQYPDLYEMVAEACEVLGTIDGKPIPVPKIYLGYTGKQDLRIANYKTPCIIIGNDFLWAFKPAELRYLLARKVGHIHCRHVFFLDIVKGARGLVNSALPEFLSRLILGGLGGTLLDWLKEAEISADRAGLLVTGDVDVAANALIKLNIFASLDDFYGQASPEAFARQLEAIDQTRLATAAAALAELKNPNPFLTVRVANLLKFYEANSSLFMDRRDERYPVQIHVDESELWEDDEESEEEERAEPGAPEKNRPGDL